MLRKKKKKKKKNTATGEILAWEITQGYEVLEG